MTIRTDSKQGLPQPGLDAAREGRDVFGYVNATTGIDTKGVLTDATFLRALRADKRLVINRFSVALSTVEDWVTVAFGVTEEADGGGVFTPHTVEYRINTGAEHAGPTPNELVLDPPIVVTQDDGQAFTAEVQGNDSGAALTLGYRGWEEDDI